MANAWQQYNDLKQGVLRTVDDVAPLVESDIAYKTQPEVKKALDQHKVTPLYYFQYKNRIAEPL